MMQKQCQNDVEKRHCNDVEKMMLKWCKENDVGSMSNWRRYFDLLSINPQYRNDIVCPLGEVTLNYKGLYFRSLKESQDSDPKP